ncbi:MAG: YceI family protein [Saprospiraceae bacterium]
MLTKGSKITAGIFAISIFLFGFSMLQNVAYNIDPSSKLYLAGSSNVVDFTCNCTQGFPDNEVYFQEDAAKKKWIFKGAELKIQSRKLDCGNKGMNRDMYNTLKADKYPTITIELLETTQPHDKSFMEGNHWVGMDAKVAITIAGVRKIHNLAVESKKLSNTKFEFKSCQTLYMTDFGIEPPKPFMGMIKVKDEILIHMDLIIKKK